MIKLLRKLPLFAVSGCMFGWALYQGFLGTHLLQCLACAIPVPAWVVLTSIPLLSLTFMSAGKARWLWLAGVPLVVMMWMGLPMRNQQLSTDGAIKVMTYNVASSSRGEEQIAGVIHAENPDILCVQEGRCYRPYWNTMRVLKRALPNHIITEGVDMIIASKYPVLKVENRTLVGNPEGRRALIVHLQTPFGEIRCINVHLVPEILELYPTLLDKIGRFSEVAQIKRQQANQLVELTNNASKTILCGDFNRQSGGAWYRVLSNQMVDTFAASGDGYGYTLTTEIPVERIDYIWASRDLMPVASRVLDVRSSDHKPVVTWLRMN